MPTNNRKTCAMACIISSIARASPIPPMLMMPNNTAPARHSLARRVMTSSLSLENRTRLTTQSYHLHLQHVGISAPQRVKGRWAPFRRGNCRPCDRPSATALRELGLRLCHSAVYENHAIMNGAYIKRDPVDETFSRAVHQSGKHWARRAQNRNRNRVPEPRLSEDVQDGYRRRQRLLRSRRGA